MTAKSTVYGKSQVERRYGDVAAGPIYSDGQVSAVMFSAKSVDWRTPTALYTKLDAEFHFTLDPCPIGATDGLLRSWEGERVYCNPPYGRTTHLWLAKARSAVLAVYLLPARTDTKWFHEYIYGKAEIRFLRGRLRFNGVKMNAPFPSMVVIFR